MLECLFPAIVHKDNATKAWKFLHEFCSFYIAKHITVLIKKEKIQLEKVGFIGLKEIIERSLYYISDKSDDLDVILKFSASILNHKDVYEVFRRVQRKFDKSSAFDFQILPKMAEFIKQTDPSIAY